MDTYNNASPHSLPPPASTATGEWADSLDNLGKLLSQAQTELTILDERMFGCSPDAEGRTGSVEPVPNGRADDITRRLSSLTSMAQRLSTTANRLNNCI